jgi:SAM-dependent methyltransferase
MTTNTYLFGRSAGELRRLAQQAALVEPETEELFQRSGITAGMHVLDVGSGAGDVAMLAGRLVRPNGTVLGIERSADSVALAASRATAAATVAVRFEEGDLNTYEPSTSYDALIGRFVLPYLADAPGVLRRLASHVRPGGVIAFMEFDVTRIGSVPDAPLFGRVASWITRAFEGTGIDPALGSSLGVVFRSAGLPWPYMTSFQKASCGPEGFYWLFAETVRTLLPHIVRLGLASAEQVDIETLESRLRDEAVAMGHTVFSPRWVGAWVRVPPQGAVEGRRSSLA